jgi:type IV pilus assembly protein PilC
MAGFQYIIKDPKGTRVEGVIRASNMDEAVEKLSKDGNMIISIKSASEAALRGEKTLFDKLMFSLFKLKTAVPLKTLVFFTRQLSTMFSAGLTIEKSISNLAKGEKNKKFKKVLITLSNDIKKGFSLSEAMERHPGVFDPLYVSLVKSGEISGTLHTVLSGLADYLEKIEDTRRKVVSAMSYPAFILAFLIIVTFLIFYLIIPKFATVYAMFNANLPLPTLIAVKISEIIKNNVFFTFLSVLFVAFFLYILYLSDKGRYIIDTLLLKIPVIGNIVTHSIMSKFARTFSILMSAGVPIMDTINLVENVVQNAVIQKAIAEAKELVKEGYTVASAFEKTGEFPHTLLQLIATGEETGEMDKLLMKGAEFHQKLLDSVIDRLTSLIEPLLIVLLAVVVGGIVIITYLPLFNIGNAMTGGVK